MRDGRSGRPYSAALAREEGPFRRLLTRYFRRRLPDGGDEVEDLVQDTFARVVARDSCEPIDNLSGYMITTASSVLTDRVRRRAARHADLHVAFEADQHGHAQIDPERTLAAKQELDAAIGALLALPERTRTVFLLYRMEGYRQREIAKHLGISVSTVEKDMVRAIRHLGATMEQRHGS